MYKFIRSGIPIIILFIILASCYPKGPEYYSDLDLTVTDYDPDYKFGDQKYYWLADTVRYVTNQEDDDIDPADEAALIEKIESKFAEQNYKRVQVSSPDSAEFVIVVTVISTRNTGVGWVPGPPWYPGWGWGPGWGGWYPPYWGGYYTFSFNTGSVITDWYDPQTPPVPLDGEEQQPTHWVATFNGLISSSHENNIARIDFSIDQAFKQSPYIKSNR